MEHRGRSKFNTQIYEEACEWFVECRAGDLDDAARGEFDRWLRKSPDHSSAYLEIAAIWNEAPSFDSARRHNIETLVAEAASDRDNIVALPGGRASPDVDHLPHEDAASPPPRIGNARRRLVAIAASIAVLGVAVGALAWFEATRAPTYATSVGEQRFLSLPDGSTVALNSRSKIRIRFAERERDVELVEGQALFHVAKDAARPFVVKVGNRQVRAVGTEFDVYRRRGDTVVTVVEGRVAVPGVDPAGRGVILVSAGEQLTVTGNAAQKSDHANVAGATAWTQRQLVFESASLAEVAEEFNRYNGHPLVIEDPSLDTFHISGVFSSTDPASLLRFLRTRPGLRIVETASEVRIERNNQN
jgi:transmembrane sensor